MNEVAERVEPEPIAASGPENVDLLALLEQRVTHLVEQYREARSHAAELRAALSERETRLEALAARVGELEQLRGEVSARVERLIAQVDHLERRG